MILFHRSPFYFCEPFPFGASAPLPKLNIQKRRGWQSWLNAAVLKTVRPGKGLGGSNPPSSAPRRNGVFFSCVFRIYGFHFRVPVRRKSCAAANGISTIISVPWHYLDELIFSLPPSSLTRSRAFQKVQRRVEFRLIQNWTEFPTEFHFHNL